MRSSVDLPQPDGPTRTTNSPSSTLEVDVAEHARRAVALGEFLDAQVGHAEAPYLTAPAVRPLMSWREKTT